jgi:hypothetical protein
VSAVALRPGLLLDRVEALLRAAEETRVREPEGPAKPEMRRPRPHRGRHEPEPKPEPPAPRPRRPAENGQPRPRYSPPEELTSAASKVVDVAKLEEEPVPEEELVPDRPLKEVDPDRIDRVALAREFGRLIAESESGEEQ